MREDTGIIKAGMAIVISSGCYSDSFDRNVSSDDADLSVGD